MPQVRLGRVPPVPVQRRHVRLQRERVRHFTRSDISNGSSTVIASSDASNVRVNGDSTGKATDIANSTSYQYGGHALTQSVTPAGTYDAPERFGFEYGDRPCGQHDDANGHGLVGHDYEQLDVHHAAIGYEYVGFRREQGDGFLRCTGSIRPGPRRQRWTRREPGRDFDGQPEQLGDDARDRQHLQQGVQPHLHLDFRQHDSLAWDGCSWYVHGDGDGHSDTSVNTRGNRSTGLSTTTQIATDNSSVTATGGNGSTSYTQSVTGTNGATFTLVSNGSTGDSSNTSTVSSSSTRVETGSSPTTGYSLRQVQGHSATGSDKSSETTGEFTLTNRETNTSSLTQSGWEGTAHSYDLKKTTLGAVDSTQVGNSWSGEYTFTGESGNTSTAIETLTHGGNGATFTEILTDDVSQEERGNVFVGVYKLTETGCRSADFVDRGNDGSGNFFVTEGSTGNYDRTEVGNSDTGAYSYDETSETDHSFTQILSARFGLHPFGFGYRLGNDQGEGRLADGGLQPFGGGYGRVHALGVGGRCWRGRSASV